MPVPRCKPRTPLGSPRTPMRSVSPRTRCGVQCGSKDQVPLPVFLDTASKRGMTGKSPRTTMRGPARGRKGQVPLPVFPGYRVEARYDVVVTLHPMRGPARGRKGQVPQTVFLDTASQHRVTPHPMRGPEKGKTVHSFAGIPGMTEKKRNI